MSFDQRGNQILGRLGSDRPHHFKAFGFYLWPWGTTTGLSFNAASGTPITREASIQHVPVQYLGRLSDGRTPALTETDLLLAHDFRLGGDNRIQISLNVLEYFAGRVDIQRRIGDAGVLRDPRFLQASVFQAPRSVRLALKYLF